MLFPPPLHELDDPQVEAALREAMIGAATGLTRIADTYLAAQSARVLVDRLRLSGVGFYVLCGSPPHPYPSSHDTLLLPTLR